MYTPRSKTLPALVASCLLVLLPAPVHAKKKDTSPPPAEDTAPADAAVEDAAHPAGDDEAASSTDTYASEQDALLEAYAAGEDEGEHDGDGALADAPGGIAEEDGGGAEAAAAGDGVGEPEEQVAAADGGDSGEESEELHDGIARKHLDIEGVDHELTEKYRRQFSTTHGQKILISSLRNAARYRPYIVQQLREKELPLYLQYLPIVESNYIPTAVSRSGATGIWQFMENSMAPMLKKDTWFDERRDAWKSTDAALAKLADNYRFFGDWAIAIAAYNCGAGAMSRALGRNPGKTFWDLAEEHLIPQQSAQYVPKLLAIADLVENAEYYGLPDVAEANRMAEEAEVEEFDYVTTIAMLSFGQIAEVTGVDKVEIKFLNQALFRNCTPARETYQLRLPKGTGEGVEEKFKEQGVAADAVIYTVIKGDTLWGISRRYGITVADICDVNGIREGDVLSIGKRLIVPIFN